jgi:hypothetical protein
MRGRVGGSTRLPALILIVSLHPEISLPAITMGGCCSKQVGEPVAEAQTPKAPPPAPKEETRPSKEETQPKGETPSKGAPVRETAILVLSFASIISGACVLLTPMKVVSESIKKILEITKVSFNLPGESDPLFITHNPKECAGGGRGLEGPQSSAQISSLRFRESHQQP